MLIERLSHEVPWTPLLASQVVMAVELQQAKVGAFGRRLRPVPVNLPPGLLGEERDASGKDPGSWCTAHRITTQNPERSVPERALKESLVGGPLADLSTCPAE